MSTRKDSAAKKAAKPAAPAVKKETATPVTPHGHKPNGVKDNIKKKVSVCVSLLITTITFSVLLFITLSFDKYVLHYLFTEYAEGTDHVLVYMFKGAKYLAVLIELAFFVYGVYKDCKHHIDED